MLLLLLLLLMLLFGLMLLLLLKEKNKQTGYARTANGMDNIMLIIISILVLAAVLIAFAPIISRHEMNRNQYLDYRDGIDKTDPRD